ncbi:MAG: DUF4175 domain-containing protein [Paracoccaceae bacterium]
MDGRRPARARKAGILTSTPDIPLHLVRPLRLTLAGLRAERIVAWFWPLWTVLLVALIPVLWGWIAAWPLELVWGWTVAAALGLTWAAWWGWRGYRAPTQADALVRLDATMPGRPIAAMTDAQAAGLADPASRAVWEAHVARMSARTAGARAPAPDMRLARHDPYGLRHMALLGVVAALIFGAGLSLNRDARSPSADPALLAAGPAWEGWVTPPAHTGRPTLYLPDQPAGPLRLDEGSRVTLRLYGDPGALTVDETVSGRTEITEGATSPAQAFDVARSGRLAIDGRGGVAWEVTVAEDAPPVATFDGPLDAGADGTLRQPFSATDDHAVEAVEATIALDLAAIDRRHGLAADPDPREPLTLSLPLPITGARDRVAEVWMEDLSLHPFANLPVTIRITATDAVGQTSVPQTRSATLPGRRFFQPLARAVAEQRRDLLWSRDNAGRVAQLLRAVSHRPEDLSLSETSYLRLRAIVRRIEASGDRLTPDVQDEIAQALWDLAIQLEEGSLADARERLARAQERLEQAMRDGASDAEIAALMDELRAATEAYTRMLAQQQRPGDGTDEPERADGETFEFTQDELQALMDRIQELMEEGRMAEAAELMEQLNDLLENMQVAEGQPGEGNGQGQQSMQDLSDTLREQQDLSDEAFREMQEGRQQGQRQGQQPGQQSGQQPSGQQGQGMGEQPGEQQGQAGRGDQPAQRPGEGAPGEGQDGSGSGGTGNDLEGDLADRQQALREELSRQRGGLPNLPGEEAEDARRALESAEGAMDDAAEALRDGDLAQAIDDQSRALDALREGLRDLGDAMARNDADQPGQGQAEAQRDGRPVPGGRDPLGRQRGEGDAMSTEEGMLQGEALRRRAGEILEELRRRSAERDRPAPELEYYDRLLDRF